jgi:glycosyltransferase involved in cell wall biosynthesis
MTSLSESFCLAALEAMACGVPVLATNVGGLSEVVVPGETGFLFPVGAEELAVRLGVNLLSNRSQHQAMQEAAIHRSAYFEDQRVVPLYEDLYRDLLLSKFVRFQFLLAKSEANA